MTAFGNVFQPPVKPHFVVTNNTILLYSSQQRKKMHGLWLHAGTDQHRGGVGSSPATATRSIEFLLQIGTHERLKEIV
jgi:hypothetical protein